MSYLIINEDLKTILHNIWTRPIFGTDGGYDATAGAIIHSKISTSSSKNDLEKLISGIPFLISSILNHITNGTDYIDNKYFDSMYKIYPGLSKKISQWCEELGASKFTNRNINGGFTVNGVEINIKSGRHKNTIPNANKPKASRGFLQKGALETCTAYKKIPSNVAGSYYIVYFTFDGESIIDAKVLNLKPNKNPNYLNSFEVKYIRKFKSVKLEEYIRRDKSK